MIQTGPKTSRRTTEPVFFLSPKQRPNVSQATSKALPKEFQQKTGGLSLAEAEGVLNSVANRLRASSHEWQQISAS